MKTLLERDWVTIVGHRDVPGKPAIYATTKQFLDYFNLKSLEDLPPLAEIRDLDQINAELSFPSDAEETTESAADTEKEKVEAEETETVVNLDVEEETPDGDADVATAMTAEH